VQRFQKRVLADPDLACHFGGMDMRRIMAHQINLLSLFFAGSTDPHGRSAHIRSAD
jgi:hypothetical protein